MQVRVLPGRPMHRSQRAESARSIRACLTSFVVGSPATEDVRGDDDRYFVGPEECGCQLFPDAERDAGGDRQRVHRSSLVEHLTANQRVAGSKPADDPARGSHPVTERSPAAKRVWVVKTTDTSLARNQLPAPCRDSLVVKAIPPRGEFSVVARSPTPWFCASRATDSNRRGGANGPHQREAKGAGDRHA
jgi:hypothetical protein